MILAAILLQLPVFWVLTRAMDSDGKPVERPLKLSLIGYQPPPPKPDKEPEDEPLPPDARIVELPEEEPPPTPPEPIDTRNLASRDARVDKEQRSERVAPPDKSQHQGKVRAEQPSPVRSPDSESPEPTVTSESEERLALAAPDRERPEADRGTQRPKSVLFDGAEDKILMPATTEHARIASLQGLSDEFASDDYLPDVEERGQSTLLNANRYKYSDFFYRVKEALRRHWQPNRVYQMRDPLGRVYGVKDRYTELRVTLDDEGRLVKLVTTTHSGLDFMDDEARAAFQRAQPFPNPPRGLVRDGEINFQFGFYFEISSGKQRFRWRRL
ncbi:MAG: TonB C-terminal domain-containing protein [Deltaproteobacteria bacterium]|nr:TonB C-terminal domain-containing protein [Deltaproteobacteria bacterium]MCB9786987.1 TonB C-terminal domain-containing protein [Deltaproteobacteria bacterium]